MNRDTIKQAFNYLESNRDNMVQTLKEFVSMNSFSKDTEDVVKAMEHLKGLFEEESFTCRLIDVEKNGPTLVGIYNEENKNKPVLFSGHADTVIEDHVYDEKFRVEGNKAYGPGVLDMKGGIITGLYAIKALIHSGYRDRPIKIIFSGDEEIGHFQSKGAEALQEEAKGAVCAFNLETGLIDNSICVGRKGRILYHVNVTGVESHAGNDFLTGRNAIEEMAYKIIEIQKLTDLDKGTTVTASVIKGGTVSNAIPKECNLEVECRFETKEEMEKYQKNLKEICSKPVIDGTKTDLVFMGGFSPFETTDEVLKLYDFIEEVAKENKLPETKKIRLGGSSDAAYIQAAGVPVLCSIGIQGQWNHTTREYALLDSMVDRSKLLSASVINLERFTE